MKRARDSKSEEEQERKGKQKGALKKTIANQAQASEVGRKRS